MTTLPTLPRKARTKLTSLQGMAADARDAAASAQRRINDLNFTLTAQEMTPEDADSMREEIGRLQTMRDRETTRHAVLGEVTGTIQRWLAALPRGAVIELAPPPHAKPQRGEALADAVSRIRREIADLQAEWRQARTAPQPKSVLREQAKEQVRSLAQRGRPHVAVDKGALQIGFVAKNSFGFGDNRVAEMLAWLHEDAFVKRITAEIDALPEPAIALTTEQRDRVLDQVTNKIVALERIEEAFIEQAQTGGTEVLRRPEVGAPAVLGVVVGSRVKKVA